MEINGTTFRHVTQVKQLHRKFILPLKVEFFHDFRNLYRIIYIDSNL